MVPDVGDDAHIAIYAAGGPTGGEVAVSPLRPSCLRVRTHQIVGPSLLEHEAAVAHDCSLLLIHALGIIRDVHGIGRRPHRVAVMAEQRAGPGFLNPAARVGDHLAEAVAVERRLATLQIHLSRIVIDRVVVAETVPAEMLHRGDHLVGMPAEGVRVGVQGAGNARDLHIRARVILGTQGRVQSHVQAVEAQPYKTIVVLGAQSRQSGKRRPKS